MYGIIDRFEGKYAVVEWESGQMSDVLRSDLPPHIKAGDVIRIQDSKYVIDLKKTKEIKEETEELFKNLWDK